MSRLCTPFGIFVAGLAATLPLKSLADEGGVSFWAPGLYGSLAAAPGTPGLAFAAVYYHVSADAGGGRGLPSGGQVRAGLDARVDSVFLNANYISPNPVWGAQFAFGLAVPVGRVRASVEATLNGPGGGVVSGAASDTFTGFGDLYPTATLKWNRGVHNYMTYLTGDIPLGSYRPGRLANLSIGHAAIDGGVGYTYLDPAKGHEFSFVTGLTYNFENSDTNYQNGVDWHLDWGASQFLSKQLHVGLVGYFYHQLTDDSGGFSAALDGFKSRVAGVGPQFGYIYPVGDKWQGYMNLKGYYEFAAKNRPEGWNVWLTFAISPAAPHEGGAKKVTK
jgi:hypothetical protein